MIVMNMREDFAADTGGVQGRKPRATAANFQTHLQLSVSFQIIFFVFRKNNTLMVCFISVIKAFIAKDKKPLLVKPKIWYDKLWSE